MKNKSALYISIGIVVLVLVVGAVVIKNLSGNTDNNQLNEEEQVELPPADPSILVDVKAKPDGKTVVLSISKIPRSTVTIEYELSYLTGDGLPKGALGKITLNDKTEIIRDILLGTCSTGGKCTYDSGVTSVKLVLKFNSPSGATQFTKEFPLK